MTDPGVEPITQLLIAANHGDAAARQRLWDVVYARLRQLARARLQGERPNHTLSTTALVHEAYLQLDLVVDRINTSDRNHFFALACKIMRQILIENARQHKAIKRKAIRADLVTGIPDAAPLTPREDVLTLDSALRQLESLDPDLGRVVECRFFGGLTTRETAEVMGVSSRTVERHWIRARTYLYRALKGAPLS